MGKEGKESLNNKYSDLLSSGWKAELNLRALSVIHIIKTNMYVINIVALATKELTNE